MRRRKMPNRSSAIPEAAWKRRFDQKLEKPGRPSYSLSLRHLLQEIPMILRLRSQLKLDKAARRVPMINFFKLLRTGATMGVPLGGIGAGSITRGWLGEFRRWQLRPGIYHYQPVFADQFSIFVQHRGEEPRVQTLHPGRPESEQLSSWKWDMDPKCATYYGLFPRAWTVYEEPVPNIRLTCQQLSPVIPHNYRESSFPVGVFDWRIENLSSKPAKVGIMFTFQNGIGSENDQAGGHSNRSFQLTKTDTDGRERDVVGVTLRYIHRQAKGVEDEDRSAPLEVFEDPLTFAIATENKPDTSISWRTRFVTSEDGAELWNDFSQNGEVKETKDVHPSVDGETIGAALVATMDMEPQSSCEVTFALSWDMPLVRTGFGTKYYRRYSQFYGRDGSNAPSMAGDALIQFPHWEDKIVSWQRPILEDATLPLWYKSTLFNELYYIVDGGTMWVYRAGEEDPWRDDIGRFAYLEGHEYRMYNTYDVHFYASFALSTLWPRLELSLQRDIANCVRNEYPEEHRLMYSGHTSPRKKKNVVPHDIGSPGEDPWTKVNIYNIHDTSRWKDLNPKFVLQVYRDYIATGDQYFLADVWDAVYEAIEYIQRYDQDGDGLIENEGIPDQTYDMWSVTGPSAYTGGLWLACLSAAARMAEALGEEEIALTYRGMYQMGQAAYDEKLWNGRYYNYDSSDRGYHDSIMADQMAGQWYARACGLPPIVEPTRAQNSLQTIFNFNVKQFQDGKMGAVNGMRPNGQVDQTSMQSREVWAGTTYALAAAMLQEGLHEEAFETAKGIYNVTYHDRGYWFQTPEAWDAEGNYRSLAYMRPLAVWAMQWALERLKDQTGQIG
jgi:non-lysosomal glucosylceramidase